MKAGIKIALLVFLIGFTTSLFSQDFWEQLYFPDSVNIKCLATNNQGHIFVGVGSSNESDGIYRSIDNAQTWEFVYNNNDFAVLSMDIDENGYIYVGKNGYNRLIVSKTNGQSWEDISLPPSSVGNVMEILCIGQDTIYVSTWEVEGSFILFSFDGAETWDYRYVTDRPNEYISDIELSSTGEVFVSTSGYFWDQGGVYRSDDAGLSWEYAGLLNHQVLTLAINSNDDIFTGDWWVINNDTSGIYALYDGLNAFDLLLGAYHVTDIAIDLNDNIYAAANDGVVYSFDNGLTFNHIEGDLSANIEFLHIASDGHLYGTRFNRIVKSIDPITGVGASYTNGITSKAYPNPASFYLYIEIPEPRPSTIYELHIYDMFGKIVYENKACLNANPFYIDVSLLTAGYYLVEIRQNDKIYKSSFVKS
ncbi:MAG: T9SS type A sorting domain-containing protein [Lentimicrobium sp.]|jgi:hypothetical protein|nr:T9SS type A sorting domain-containing protein [Lentimicrobium sp.]